MRILVKKQSSVFGSLLGTGSLYVKMHNEKKPQSKKLDGK
jgi:hypothetical protein